MTGRASEPRSRAFWGPVLLGLILLAGAALRLYGLNWDEGHWLQPDERQIYFIALDLGWPTSLAEALSPESPLNPGFFAYGSLPIYLVRLAAVLLAPVWPAVRDSDNLHLVGRLLAVLFDLGTVYFTYRLARQLGRRRRGPQRDAEGGWDGSEPGQPGAEVAPWIPLLAAAMVSLAVLHIQLAHFYTADPLLVFFVMLTLGLAFDVARGAGRWQQIGLGVSLGLALATKVSAAPLALVVLVAYYDGWPRAERSWKRWSHLWPVVRRAGLSLLIAAAVFFVMQPYALIDWSTFVGHTLRESQIAWGRFEVPYTLQYAGTWPYLYPAWQVALWGLALPVGVAAWAGLASVLVGWLRRGGWAAGLILAWIGAYFAITGLLHAKPLRYMLPLVPVLCVLAGYLPLLLGWRRGGLVADRRLRRWLGVAAYGALVVCSLVYAFLYVQIYAKPHSWITASDWIYRHVPAGSTLAVEHWDMLLPLPLELDGRARRIEEYDTRVLALYDEPDNGEKWERLAVDLAGSDYVIIASRRLYGSIVGLENRYPLTSRYYELLLREELGFELAGEFVRGPEWLNPRVLPLPRATPSLLQPDESFVVYDHPRALIFRNAGRLSAEELLGRIGVSRGSSLGLNASIAARIQNGMALPWQGHPFGYCESFPSWRSSARDRGLVLRWLRRAS
ncbi:MAG: ArnT family glycosyltransferase [Anaerolineae bacterium]